MNRLLVTLHRWVGLGLAAFLFVAGLTGSVLAFDRSLDAAINPELFVANSAGNVDAPAMTGFELAELLERRDGRLRAGLVSLAWAPGGTASIFVVPRIDPETGKPHQLDFEQVFLDPVTGEEQGRRLWGQLDGKQDVIPWLYQLHYSLHLPGKWGEWLMGFVGIVWLLDCFVALYIAFPNRKTWRQSFLFRLRQGGLRAAFDLHRSGGVWVWGLLLVAAFTSIWMNLSREVVAPIVDAISPLTRTPFDAPLPKGSPFLEPAIDRRAAAAVAVAEATRLGIEAPIGLVNYHGRRGLYATAFFDHSTGQGGHGWRAPWLYVDGRTGEVVYRELGGTGSLGDQFVALQYPLHSGRILGQPGRILIAVLGVVIAMLSVTGVVLWANRMRKRVAAIA